MMRVFTIALLTLLMTASINANDLPLTAHNESELLGPGAPWCLAPEFHFNYPGEDASDFPAASYEECCDLCARVPSCGAYTWTTYQSGTCYMKFTRTGSEWKGGLPDGSAQYISGEAYRCKPPTKDVDFVGEDLLTRAAPRPETCCQFCVNARLCRGYSWSSFNGGTCWLKGDKSQAVYSPGTISAYR